MKKSVIIIGILIGLLAIILLFRTDIVNTINLLKCKNIDGSFSLTNFDYELEFVVNVTGSKNNQIIECDKLFVYEENKKIIYSPNKGKKTNFLVLGDKYYRLNKVGNLEEKDLDIIKNYFNNNKKTSLNYYKIGDVIISNRKASTYVDIDAQKADELVNILNKVK